MAKSIEFPGTAGNRYEHTINANQDLDGATTILAVVRMLAANSTWQSIVESESSGGVNQVSMGRNVSVDGRLYYSDTAAVKDFVGVHVVAADSWQVIAVTRPAGAAQTIRGHQVVLGGATQHVNSGSTGNNNGDYNGGAFIVAGDDDPANIRVAAWAVWNGTALSDGDIEGIASALSTDSILALSPTACFDAENGLMLTDLAAGGMDGSLVGAITESADGPTGWTYYGEHVPSAPTNLWDYAGILLFGLTDNASAMGDILDWCVENKFKWVAMQCFDDTTLIEQSQIPTWKAAVQSRDLIFGLWGVQHDDPSGDASRASSQINLWGADFYIANAELEYKVDGPGTRAHSATFVNAFRALQPDIRSALCSYGAIANDVGILGSTLDVNAGVMDFKTWYDNGFHFLPQAYASDPVYEPYRVVQQYRRCNVPFTHFHLMAGIYTGGTTFDGADYRAMFTALVNTEWEMTIQADGPVVFYKLQDVSGNPQDSSTSGLNISTVVGTPDYSQTSILDRVASIRMTGGETLSRAVPSTAVNNVSAEYLFKREAQGANDQIIFYNGNSGTNGWGLVCNIDGTFRVLLGGVGFQAFADGGAAFAIDAWYHVVVVRDATVWRYYLNGALQTSNAGTGTPGTPTGNLQINDGSIQVAGCMFAMYNTVLTAAQIARRYAWLTGNRVTGPDHSRSPYGFSLFLGETGGALGAVVEQDYIDLGLAIQTDRSAQGAAAEKQTVFVSRRRMVSRR
jgi:hypothetical protein